MNHSAIGRQRRILFAIPALADGGPDRVFFELLSGLPRDRFELHLAVQADAGRYLALLPGDVTVHLVRGGGRHAIRPLARLVDALAPDAVITTLRMNLTAIAARLLQRRRCPVIVRQANMMSINFAQLRALRPIQQRIAQPLIRAMLRRADMVIAQSDAMAADLVAQLGPRARVVTIGNPIDVDATLQRSADQLAADPILPAGAPALVAAGRLGWQKGFDLLVAAMPIVLRHKPGAVLTIYGVGPSDAALRRQVMAAGLERHVVLAGQSDAVLAQMAAADLVISSSRTEAFSNALLEAMALGCVVVATDVPGATGEMIDDGRTGYLAPPNGAAVLGRAILRGLDGERAAIGAAAQASIRANYAVLRICDHYAGLFDRVIAARAAIGG